MSCWDTFQAYAFRSLGIGERMLPREDFTVCQEVVLIGSGLLWNLYFAAVALLLGFFLATGLALLRNSSHRAARKPAEWFIFLFRGSPLFIQFFLAYEAFVLLPRAGIPLDLGLVEITVQTGWLTRAWAGATLVLFLNTAAYSAEIFYGALRSVPHGEVEAAEAYGFNRWQKFRHVVWPTLLRLAWPAYTNEAIFLFHATTLVFFSGFPAWRQQGDALYYASYFADKTFNPFLAYPIAAAYFILATLALLALFRLAHLRLHRHLPAPSRPPLRFRLRLLR
jgi:polar amino acid transport system permease protein